MKIILPGRNSAAHDSQITLVWLRPKRSVFILNIMESLKRKRTSNFTAEEKLRFVRLLREEGQCIISKVTSHDAATNKEKELAWRKITNIHNSGGDMIRTTETLKKLWGKLKSEAKTFKAAYRHSVSGTGGGPSKKFEDPILELVAEITGRASTGIMNINDCDAVANETLSEDDQFGSASPKIEYLDESFLIEYFPEDKINAIEDLVDEDKNTAQETAAVAQKQPIQKKNEADKTGKEAQQIAVNLKQINETRTVLKKINSENVIDIKENVTDVKQKAWANRRRPDMNIANERTEKIKNRQRASNRFAAERLRAEQEKSNLIMQQKTQFAELHNIKMENERLKQELLKTLINKVSDADSKDVVTVATQDVLQSLE